MAEKTLAQFANEHYEWIESVGWAGVRTPLESLGRIGSEIGELVNECRGDSLGDGFSDEISDVILSCITFIKENQAQGRFNDYSGINGMSAAIYVRNTYPISKAREFKSIFEAVSYGFVVLSDVITEHERCKDEMTGAAMEIVIFRASTLLDYFLAVARKSDINISQALTEKMAKNEIKGNRGRKK